MGFDQWLEAPYQDNCDDEDAFVDWAEEEGYDLSRPDQVSQAEADYDDYLQGLWEDAAVAKHEARMERLEMEAEESWGDW